jgi:nicotinamidase-related amidase
VTSSFPPGRAIDRADSVLLVVDLQGRLMPAIDRGDAAVGRAKFVAATARTLGVPALFTEQNPAGLGPTVEALAGFAGKPVAKRHFNACEAPDFIARLPMGRRTMVMAGAETHVCVLQTALGLIAHGRRVAIVADAVGSRRPEDKEAGLRRLAAHGAEIVTAEMVAFEWLNSCDDPAFRTVIADIKSL